MVELAHALANLLELVEPKSDSGKPLGLNRTSSEQLQALPLPIVLNRVIATTEAAAFCGFSVPHWRRLYRSGRAPPPIRLSTRKLGWRIGDLIIWLQAHSPSK